MKKKILFFGIAVGILLLDQITKWMVVSHMSVGDSILIIKDFFYLAYVQNTGGAFSILSGHVGLLIVISIAALFGIYYLWKNEKKQSYLNLFGYSLLIGGTLGNLMDRFMHNYVIDFFYFIFGNYHFPVFNIGDMAIVIGVGLICIGMLVGEKNERNNSRTVVSG